MDTGTWLEDAEQGVRFLEQSCRLGEEIVLFASGPHLYVHAVLVPHVAVSPPDHDDIERAHFSPSDSWCIERAYGGGGGSRIYLEHPLNNHICRTIVGGEKLIFSRSFEGVKSYQLIEISQKLVHALGLYYIDERNAYCRLDNHGDFEDIISVCDDKHNNPWQRVRAVTIRRHDLETYMALSDTSLVTKFDFTRYVPGAFSSWEGQNPQEHKTNKLCYRVGIIPNQASYANGHTIFHTALTENDLIEEWQSEENVSTKQYASFIIFDRKNDTVVETSCGLGHIVNYFIKDSDLPWEISPAFFRPEVLQKYKADPERYTLSDRSISCRGAWYLKTYDINEAGQVHTYIGYLADLPYSEQLYWKSFNERPNGNISERAFQTDILGEFSTEDDPLAELRAEVNALDRTPPSWWNPRGAALVEKTLYPATDSIEEWGNEILALDHLIVEGFFTKGLRPIISANGGSYEKIWGSIKLLEIVLSFMGYTVDDAKKTVAPLKELHNLRNPAKAHGNPSGKQEVVSRARKDHTTLRKHFHHLAGSVRNSFKEIVSVLHKI